MNSKSSIPNFNNTSSNNNLFTNNIHNHGENLQNNDYEPHYTNSKNQLLHSESYKNKTQIQVKSCIVGVQNTQDARFRLNLASWGFGNPKMRDSG